MKKTSMVCLSITICLFSCVCMAQTPCQVGGIVLGNDIVEHSDRVKMETALPIRYMEYIKEVEIKDIPGFKSGLVAYGVCEKPGRILRIKLKYADSSKKFFDTLLKRYKDRFGKPEEWRGDPFHVFIAWKWSFTDRHKNSISLILQHNTKDEEEKIGNAVKLTITNFIEEERRCFEARHPEINKPAENLVKEKKTVDSENWDLFIPQ